MRFLKGLGVSVLSFLLFLSLSIFGLVLMLNQTILNPDFVVSEVDKLDLAPLVQELVSQQFPKEAKFMAQGLGDTIADLKPWIKEQVSALTYSGYDYLRGRSQRLSVVIPLEPVKNSLKDNLRQVILASPPPELAGASRAQIEQYFNEFYQQFTKNIPATFEVNESSFPTEVQTTLRQARQAISYVELSYKVLIGFMLLLVLGIILINRQVRSTSRGLGINFLSIGVLEYASIFIFNRLLGPQLTQLNLPSSVQAWLPQFLGDLLAPLEMFSIGLAVAGVALIIVSVIYKREPSL